MTELTLTQIQIMENCCQEMPVFILGLPKEDDDVPTKTRLQVCNDEVDTLVSLGFLTDLTSKNLESMEILKENTGHAHRVFCVSDTGRAFFKATASTVIN